MIPGRISTIGPYRLEDRLGAGGMGEVWRARDERLDRSVAVKLIRPESAEDQTARERFRREARAAAALTHPSVVRIYDIIESGEGDAIVMELVEGELLARRIARGPLPVDEAVHLGRQIAEGLAAAHRRGILHRDLKAENVIVTPEGEAKILDFGLAKRMNQENEASLTRSAGFVGTFRSVSPEQARGLTLDHRSDLFSFGVLLYEMLTGESPFKAETPLETLSRICSLGQIPIRRLRPEVPRELSSLVDELLEKDPARRPEEIGQVIERLARPGPSSPASARETEVDTETVINGARGVSQAPGTWPSLSGRPAVSRRWIRLPVLILLLLAGVAAALIVVRRVARPEPVYVAVPRPEIGQGAGIEAVEMMATGLRENILQGLLSFEGIRPLAAEEVDGVQGRPREVARAVAAGEALTARLDCPGETCLVSLSRVAGEDGRLLWTASFSAAADQPYALPDAVRGYLQSAYERQPRKGSAAPAARPEDYVAYLQLRQAYDLRKQVPADLLARLAALRETSPRFLQAYLFEAEILEQRYTETRGVQDLERGLALLQRAHDLVPGDPRPLLNVCGLALRARRFDRAEEVIRELESLLPGDPGILVLRGRLLEAQGEPEQGAELLERAARSRPSWRNLYFLALAQYRLGRYAAAQDNLARLLERYPGHYDGLSLLAQVELLYGSTARAADLYRQLVRRSPGTTELSNLGVSLLLLRRYAEAEESFRQALAQAPSNPAFQLNLADALSLQGKDAAAAAAYRRILEMTDPSATETEVLSARGQALAHLRDGQGAIAAVQALLQRAQGNPEVAYEVALIYLLLGERNGALFNATQALQQGVAPRFFEFPWFDPLRSDARFQDALRQHSARTGLQR